MRHLDGDSVRLRGARYSSQRTRSAGMTSRRRVPSGGR